LRPLVSRRRVLGAGLASAGGLLLACRGAPAPTPAPTVPAPTAIVPTAAVAPRAEQSRTLQLVLYSPTVQTQTAARIAAFRAWLGQTEGADASVTHIYASTVDGFERLRAEAANPQADVVDLTNDLATLARKLGLTRPYRVQAFAAVPAFARDAEGYWYAPTISVFVIDYNAQTRRPEAAPRDWEDLIRSEYRGKLVLRDPTQSGSGGTIVLGFLAVYGEEAGKDFLYRLDAQVGGKYLESSTQTVLEVGRGAADALIWNEAYSLQVKNQQNFPNIGVVYPKSWMLAEMTTTSIVRGARNLPTAQLWLEWSMSLESARVNAQNYGRPARTDLPIGVTPDWLKESPTDRLPILNLDPVKLEEKRREWLALWSGQIRGKGADYMASNPNPPRYEVRKDFVL
jgi:iron(III) transport system substrate-binding protein